MAGKWIAFTALDGEPVAEGDTDIPTKGDYIIANDGKYYVVLGRCFGGKNLDQIQLLVQRSG